MGHALNGSDPGRADPLRAAARAAGQVDPGHRPRGDRDADPGREAGPATRARRARRSGREAFVERVWAWREQYGSTIIEPVQAPRRQPRLRGRALHPGRAYAGAVLKVFVDLYEQGLIYRDNYMVNWDPGTALGDQRPRGRGPRGHRHAVPHRLPAEPTAPARWSSPPCGPETMLADTAVAVHPEDERYQHLVGAR